MILAWKWLFKMRNEGEDGEDLKKVGHRTVVEAGFYWGRSTASKLDGIEVAIQILLG